MAPADCSCQDCLARCSAAIDGPLFLAAGRVRGGLRDGTGYVCGFGSTADGSGFSEMTSFLARLRRDVLAFERGRTGGRADIFLDHPAGRESAKCSAFAVGSEHRAIDAIHSTWFTYGTLRVVGCIQGTFDKKQFAPT